MFQAMNENSFNLHQAYPGARGVIFWAAKPRQRGATRRASYSFYAVYLVSIFENGPLEPGYTKRRQILENQLVLIWYYLAKNYVNNENSYY